MKCIVMDRMVGLFHRTVTQQPNGEDIETFPTAYARVWAKREDMKGTKRVIAQQFSVQQQIEYTIRYRSDLSSTDRLVNEDGISHEILQVAQIGRREYLNLLCRAVTP